MKQFDHRKKIINNFLMIIWVLLGILVGLIYSMIFYGRLGFGVLGERLTDVPLLWPCAFLDLVQYVEQVF